MTSEATALKRFVTFALATLAMVAVALVSMFITMRIAIHGREADVPPLTGLSLAEGNATAARAGLRLSVENRFYSGELPAGRILAQDPLPGSHVRRDWAVRVTESLGAQRVTVPELTGESERAAVVSIRRLGLEPGAVARLAVPGDPGVVIAQTPEPNSGGADSPRVSLLISDPTAVGQQAYAMPQLVGLSYAVAQTRAAAVGLRLELDPAAPLVGAANAVPAPLSLDGAISQQQNQAMPALPPAPSQPIVHPSSIISAQTPAAGRRVQQGDAVHVQVQDPVTQPLPANVTHAN